MIDSGTGAPTLTVDDIIETGQGSAVTLAVRRQGVALRFHLRLNGSYISQSRFTVEAFDPGRCQWNPVWDITPTTYTYTDGRETDAVTDPRSRLIAHPSNRDITRQAASWQKIIDALTDKVYDVFDLPR